jgi:hypothetical protein
LFLLLLPATKAAAADLSSDGFLTGYITSILERELHWERGSYSLKVVGGVATITLLKDDPARQKEGGEKLREIEGLQKVAIVVAPAAGKPGTVSRFIGVTGERESLPVGDVFHPLIADPKQPRFFVSLNRYDNSVRRYTGASVGFGETFGLYKFIGAREGDGLQLSVEGALFAQFDMDSSSHDLVNADYTIGIPVTYRKGDNSIRLRLYHQSSHLGDEYLLRAIHAQRANLSFEAAEFLYSREWRTWRVYGGGEYLIHKEPSDLKPGSFHWGLEYLGVTPLVLGGRLVGAVDMKSMEQHNWATDISAKAGLEFGQPFPGHRRLRLMGQWYKGFDPHGQFYNNRIEYYGLELALGF